MKRVGQIFRETLVGRIKDELDKNSNVFLISYSQVSSPVIGELRKKLAHSGADVYVSKNSIAVKALKDLNHDALAEKVTGQTAFVWSSADSVTIAKVVVDFAKDLENVTIQGGLLDGAILLSDDIKKLSELPSKEVLQSQLLSVIQAPITRLMGALNAKSREVLSILKQYSEQKGGS